MSDFYLVKQIMQVSRFYLVRGSSQQAIPSVKNEADNTEYLHSCDELDWEGKIKYEIVELGEDWEKDKRLKNTSRIIEDRIENPPLTPPKRKRKMKKTSKLPAKLRRK